MGRFGQKHSPEALANAFRWLVWSALALAFEMLYYYEIMPTHVHDHHHHHHPGEGHPPASISPSILRLSAVERLAAAGVMIAMIWAAVLWAMS
jgi:hypothetical protein